MAPPCLAGPDASGLDGISFRSSWVGSHAALPQLLPPYGCSSRVPWSFCGCGSLSVLLQPAVCGHHYRHLPWGLDRNSRFSLMGGPGSCPCKGSFQPHHHDCITPNHFYLPVAHHIGGMTVIAPRSTAVALHCPVVARGASNLQMHNGCA